MQNTADHGSVQSDNRNDCYNSIDLVVHLLSEYDQRTQSNYSQIYQEQGLKIEAA